MQIIVRKHSESKRFKPHYNVALGKYVGSSKDMVSEMKQRGLEPYDPNVRQPEPRTYKPSKKAHEITEYIRKNTDKHGRAHLSGKVMKEIGDCLPKGDERERKLSELNSKNGGFNND